LASGGADGMVRLWNVATHQQIGNPLTGHTGMVISVAFSPDGKMAASASGDGTIRLWNVVTHQQIGHALVARHTEAVDSVAFSPDGKIVASSSVDVANVYTSIVRLWNVTTHRQVRSLRDRQGGTSVAFSPDGKILASGGGGMVRLWDAASLAAIATLTGHTGLVTSVAFSPDSKTLASGSDDHTVRLWDMATRRQIGNPHTGHNQPVFSVAFSPDGKILASGGGDDTVRLWDVSYLVNITPHLCAAAGRSLTRAEWARYVSPGPAYQLICP
jgi:WD40 repeat protein